MFQSSAVFILFQSNQNENCIPSKLTKTEQNWCYIRFGKIGQFKKVRKICGPDLRKKVALVNWKDAGHNWKKELLITILIAPIIFDANIRPLT